MSKFDLLDSLKNANNSNSNASIYSLPPLTYISNTAPPVHFASWRPHIGHSATANNSQMYRISIIGSWFLWCLMLYTTMDRVCKRRCRTPLYLRSAEWCCWFLSNTPQSHYSADAYFLIDLSYYFMYYQYLYLC